MQAMPVLIVGYEAAPYYKRGGLGDVVGSLPKALREIGIDAHIVMPYYKNIETNHREKKIGQFSVVFGKKLEQVGIYSSSSTSKAKAPVYFLQNRTYLDKIFTRGKNKKIGQFAFFDLAVVEFIAWLSSSTYSVPNIVHCNDWHTGLIPLILKKKGIDVPTLLTIHNLNYQGKGSLKVLDSLHVADDEARVIKRGVPATKINLLGEGIVHATRVSTVSQTYAKEIMENYQKDSIFRFLGEREKEEGKKAQVSGILNGIDYEVWNPQKDTFLKAQYSLSNWKDGKGKNKRSFLNALRLKEKATYCFIGRMAAQKGLDLLVQVIDMLIKHDANVIVLGSGQHKIEHSIMQVARKYHEHMRVDISYDEQFAHRLYASADFILIPSHYEPCGLIQMVAMRYGALPIASRTGGLADSIEDGVNGFLFKKNSVAEFKKAIKKSFGLYNNPKAMKQMVDNAMRTDFSWKRSALLYKKLYEEIIAS